MRPQRGKYAWASPPKPPKPKRDAGILTVYNRNFRGSLGGKDVSIIFDKTEKKLIHVGFTYHLQFAPHASSVFPYRLIGTHEFKKKLHAHFRRVRDDNTAR
jgi:hypothetical protein